ncbi:MAG TPA: polysaccharide deacetylase family protein, partial [Flavisolibacter sp.]|nr:polysaccharide deacetylase family protein [Flavisolibacter sp.]
MAMYKYFIKTPWWVQKIFPSYVWRIPSQKKIVYLTFDDGPHPTITPWVLAQLKNYNANATFFCIGNNVRKHPFVYQQIIDEGHAMGNHTYHHLNGWKTKTDKYLDSVREASQLMVTTLFRPPYGRITRSQAKDVAAAMKVTHAAIVMWDVLSADFDRKISPDRCIKNVLRNV